MKSILVPVLFAASLGLAHAQALMPTPQDAASAAAPSPELEARIAAVDDLQTLSQLVVYYRENGDLNAELAALDRRIALRPHIGAYKLDKAVTLAREDRKSEAYTLLIEMQNAGYAYDLRGDQRFSRIADTEVWGYILDNLDRNRQPFGEGKLAYTLPREDLLLESMAFDATRRQLLVGSAREGKVYAVGEGGKLAPIASADADNGMWAVFDLVVDAPRNVLWVASTAVPHFKSYRPEADLGRAGVFKFDLKTGKFLKSYLSPVVPGQSFLLSSIALGKDGEVYVADGVNRAIYQVRDDQFRRILHAPMLGSISALAVSTDGRRLYMADPERGVLGITLSNAQPFDVRVPEKLSLEGISALEVVGNDLLVVQSGMNPARVMRLALSPEGDTIVGVRPIEASNPQFGKIGTTALDGTTLYLIANEQKDNYDRFGLLRNKDRLEGTRILRMDADFQSDEPGVRQ
ncbi:MAG: hypothetical protein OZ919_01510 [Xanthomonadaceae bacterium]|nr:hypothetical protein [Xanthomonadaceae bacterium]